VSFVDDLFAPDPSQPMADEALPQYRWLVVDGGGLATTAWSTHRDLESPELRVRATVYVFVTCIASLSRLVEPGARICVAWDGRDNRKWRRGLHPWYKHGRGSVINRDEVRAAISMVDQLMTTIGAATIIIDGREADDVVATLVTRIVDEGSGPVLVFSDDKDYIQLIDTDIHLCRRSLQGVVLTPNQCAMAGVPYGAKYLAQKAMMGDSGDNIKGLPGIGEQKALSLLEAIPNALDLARSDPDALDWSTVPKNTRNAFIRAGAKLLYPSAIQDPEFAAAVAARRGIEVPEFEHDEFEALEAAMAEAVRCFDLVELDRAMAIGEPQFPQPNLERIPAMMRKLGLQNEGDLLSSLYALAGLRSEEQVPRSPATRAGAAVR
jgi:5'-3' exonuclease